MKGLPYFFRSATALAVTAFAAAIAFGSAHAEGSATAPKCTAPSELTRLDYVLKRMSQKVSAGQPVKIVAIGSSSTAGAGASSPTMNYPSRLQVELQALMPRVPITVVNRGVNGEESRDMLARFERDVFSENPDVVVWQLGSNSVLRDRPLSEAPAPLHQGLKLLREHGADVVLMNPQYTPQVFTKHDVEGMVHLLNVAAKENSVDLFQRFALMRYWQLTEGIPFSAFTSPDELHMNDWGYGCVAKLLAGAIHDAATRPTLTATVNQRR
ncbi:SGNH/GDSL hydrolase family protein [Rhodoplanes sp. Z2-YC6860]|uniref:SGNH/GDSL hydrolase family protein n=1 Tax=Rhodoplanes sp. Z2-YC6860 TaxID=674703 RepID=UPI00078E1005|nr:SGNH/GDSL hydrolase family protein [Rhodoplanes sp. Z2-YC6860]AMN44868.1 G-D-S-L family lipolytic protein [Rhodoplanes sp. Z2-YC6860]